MPPPPPPPPTMRYSTAVSRSTVTDPVKDMSLAIADTARPRNNVVLLANEMEPDPAELL